MPQQKKLTVEEHIKRAQEHLDAARGEPKSPDDMTVEEHLAEVEKGRW